MGDGNGEQGRRVGEGKGMSERWGGGKHGNMKAIPFDMTNYRYSIN